MSLPWSVPDAVRLSEEAILAQYPKPRTRTRAQLFRRTQCKPAWQEADLALAGAPHTIPGIKAARQHAQVYLQHWDAFVDRALVA